jgi:hypothetical protein
MRAEPLVYDANWRLQVLAEQLLEETTLMNGRP